MKFIWKLSIAGLIAAWCSVPAIAEPYPARPVHIVVPFATGGGDVVVRLLAEEMRKDLGVPVVVENRPGASGQIATEAVARAAPDGYTLLFGSNTTHAAAPALFKKLPFDPIKDFRAIALAAKTPLVLLVRNEGNLTTLGELAAWMKKNPAAANYAYSHSSSQVASASFVRQANVAATAVPYKGEIAAVTDVIGGAVAFTFVTVAAARPFLEAKRARAIAITSLKRSALMPDSPSVLEAGFPGMETIAWAAFFAPANTPNEIIQRLSASVERALAKPSMRPNLASHGSEPEYMPPQKTTEFVKTQLEIWGTKIRDAGIEPQ